MGIKREAIDAQIKKAFKQQAIKHHPDKNTDNSEASKQKFAKITNTFPCVGYRSSISALEIYISYMEDVF